MRARSNVKTTSLAFPDFHEKDMPIPPRTRAPLSEPEADQAVGNAGRTLITKGDDGSEVSGACKSAF